MRNIYDRLAPIADDLLTRFDMGEMALVQQVPGNGPPYDPGPSTHVETPLQGAARPAKGGVLFEPGSLVKTGDLRVAAKVVTGIEPSVGDRLKIKGITYSIVRFDKIPPAGRVLAWVFYVRQ